MDQTPIRLPRMSRPRLAHAVLLALALCGIAPAVAQYGTPEEFRRSQPTIRDRDPGYEPDAKAEADAGFRRQTVFYRTLEAPGTVVRALTD